MTLEITIDYDDIIKQTEKLGATPEIISDEMIATMQTSLDTFEQVVSARTPVNVGHARASINTQIYGRPPTFEGQLGMSVSYGYYVEHGRGPGKRPPHDAIKYWVVRKLGYRGPEADAVAFLIARAIGRRGTKGAHMFRDGFEAAKGAVLDYWERMAERIVDRMEV